MSTFKIAFLLIFHRADLSHSPLICFGARSPDFSERIVYWLFDVNEGLRQIANWLELHLHSDVKLLSIKTSWPVGMHSRYVSMEIRHHSNQPSLFFSQFPLFRLRNHLKWLTITVNAWHRPVYRRCMAGKLKSPFTWHHRPFNVTFQNHSQWKSAHENLLLRWHG